MNRKNIEPFRAMDVVVKADAALKEGRDIIMMCLGQPAHPAPSSALNAAKAALEVGNIGYTAAPGIAPLRERLSQHYCDHYGLEVDASRIFVTTGSSAGFVLSFLSLFEDGDKIGIPVPGYPAYRNIARSLSIEPVPIRTFAEDRWAPTVENLEAIKKEQGLDGLLIANPNNPNGTMMPPDEFQSLVRAAENLDIKVISDEIYHGLTYGQQEVCALSASDDAIIINSFSKYFCMTGWRIGWMVVPETMVEHTNRLQQNLFICAPEVSQIAALAAFDGLDEMAAVKNGYERNRDLVSKRLSDLGLAHIHPMDGAFYAYADVSDWGENSLELSNRLLEEADVALTPGIDFDTHKGAGWMRFSFAGDYGRIAEGFDRIEEWIARSNRH